MKRFLFVMAGLAASALAPAQPLPEADIPALIGQRVQETQGKTMVVGIIDGNGRRYYHYGAADEHTVFGIASLTKLFTSLLLADMATKGEVGLDDPVQQLLPATVTVPSFNGQPIRLVDLARHVSGLPTEIPGIDFNDIESLYRHVSAYRLTRAAGTPDYSNVGVSLLGNALGQRAGLSYRQLVTDRIIGPLGLHETAYELTDAMRARVVPGWKGGQAQPVANVPVARAPSGGLYSTAADLLTFVDALFTPTVPSLDVAAARMRRPYPDQSGDSDFPEVRLAWGFVRGNGSDMWQHAGRIGGYNSMVAYDGRAGRGVVMLSNSAGTEMTDLAMHILNQQFKVKQMVLPAAFVRMVEASNFRQVAPAYHALRHRDPGFYLEQDPLNAWGRKLLAQHRPREALAVLIFNVSQFPKSAQAYDSLGQAYQASGDGPQAAAAYRQAVTLDPNFREAAARLQVIGAGGSR